MKTSSYVIEICFLAYFLSVNLFYLFLNTVTLFGLMRSRSLREVPGLPNVFFGFEPPISILVPAHNEEKVIVDAVMALLTQNYPEFEIIVVNDGSTDATLQTLIDAFDLRPVARRFHQALRTKPVKACYLSRKFPELRILDKENGGKADALNAGINASRYPLFCSVDADSMLEKDALYKVGRAFLEDPSVIAAGGSVRPLNGCLMRDGRLIQAGLPRSRVAMVQIVEYLRAFLFGRLGLSALNLMMIISGAFGVFQKHAVVEAGGYRTDTVGEDMELVVRLHRVMRLARKPYRITYVPDPICWTEVPETLASLRAQRIRWHRGLCESLAMNRTLFLNPRAGAIGWFAIPSLIFFEWLEPLLQLFGLAWTVVIWLFGLVSLEAVSVFLFVALALSILQSANALLLEQMSYRIFTRSGQVARLMTAGVVENLGYRQINTLWRIEGFVQWLKGTRKHWGDMARKTRGPET